MKARLDVIDSIDGFYVTVILDRLHRDGVLRALAEGHSVSWIARTFGFDHEPLTGLLDYLSLRSNLVQRAGSGRKKRYTIAAGDQNAFFAHLLDQYVGAYGPCLFELSRVLKRPAVGSRLVDQDRHAAAFSPSEPMPELLDVIEALRFRTVLDVGCGSGRLLAALARRQPLLRGIGIDANPKMVENARRTASVLGLTDRLKIMRCDFRQLGRIMPAQRRRTIDGICAASVANSFFGPVGAYDIDYFFRRLRSLFPNRILVLCDYYSRLASPRGQNGNFKRTLVHDVAQLVSAQGLPPRNLREWRTIYRRASVRLLQAYGLTDHGVSWFIHLVRL